MLLSGPKVLLFLTALIIPSDWTPLGVKGQRGDDVTQETFTEDPNLVNDPSTDETVLADIEPSTDDLASPNDKNATTKCRDEKFACTRLYSVHRPVKQCIHQLCFTSLRRMYVINSEICSRLVCKEHEAMKDELCRQMAGLPPKRLRRSNYFQLPPCENVNLQRPSGSFIFQMVQKTDTGDRLVRLINNLFSTTRLKAELVSLARNLYSSINSLW